MYVHCYGMYIAKVLCTLLKYLEHLLIQMQLIEIQFIYYRFLSFLASMRSSSKGSKSAKNSVPNRQYTILQQTEIFMKSMTITLQKRMKNFLEKCQRSPQLKLKANYRVPIYEDIYTIVQLKKNEQKISGSRTQLKMVLQQVANKLNKKYSIIYDRVRHRLNYFTHKQIQQLIEIAQQSNYNQDFEMHSPREERQQHKVERWNKAQTVREDEIMRPSKKQEEKNERNQKIEFKEKVNQNKFFSQHYSPIVEQWQLQDSKVSSHTGGSIVSSSQTNSKRQSGNNLKKKRLDPMQILKDIVSNTDYKTIKRQVKEMFIKGMNLKKNLMKSYGNYLEVQNDSDQVDLEGIWSDSEEDEVEERQMPINRKIVKINSLQPNSMIYWFNNDPEKYKAYQDNPYELDYLMWTEEEDELISKARDNLQQHIYQFKSLIKTKSALGIVERIFFLDLGITDQMAQVINKFLIFEQLV